MTGLQSCIEKTRIYKESYKANNNYLGDLKALQAVEEAYQRLNEKEKQEFKTYIKNNLWSPEVKKAGRIGGGIGAAVFPVADALWFGASTVTRAVTLGVVGFFAGSMSTESVKQGMFSPLLEVAIKGRVTQPYWEVQRKLNLGLTHPRHAASQRARYQELQERAIENENNSGLRHRNVVAI